MAQVQDDLNFSESKMCQEHQTNCKHLIGPKKMIRNGYQDLCTKISFVTLFITLNNWKYLKELRIQRTNKMNCITYT